MVGEEVGGLAGGKDRCSRWSHSEAFQVLLAGDLRHRMDAGSAGQKAVSLIQPYVLRARDCVAHSRFSISMCGMSERLDLHFR